MFNFRRLWKSFGYAVRGLAYAWHHEQNFRVQVVVAWAVCIAALLFRLSPARDTILVMLVTLILVLELLNTFFEKVIDLISPRLNHYAAVLKDILAAAVLVASCGAVIAGILIFWPALDFIWHL